MSEKNHPKTSATWSFKHLLAHTVWGSGSVQESCSWVVLVQGLSWGCDQDVSRGCRHLRAWLRLENLCPRCLTHMAVGRRLQFLSTWASPQCCLRAPTAWQLASPRVGSPSESREPTAAPSLTQSLKIPTINSTVFYLLEAAKSSPHSKGKELGFNSTRKEFRSIYLSLWHYTFVISLLSHHHLSEVSRDDTLCYFYQSLFFTPSSPPHLPSLLEC